MNDGFEGFERLWTPHRMAYVVGASGEDTGEDTDEDTDGCPFCAMREPRDGDLVVARGLTVFGVLNLHPYNPGHLMVMPYRHVADIEDLTDEEAAELMAMTRRAVEVLRQVSGPHAFNIGINLGGVAGGSLAQHLHQHVVPRWSGDANFITVLAGTKTLPQLLEQTAELLSDAWT